jgi:hypothetical protein
VRTSSPHLLPATRGGGKDGTLKAVFPVSNFDSTDNEERADPHGLAVRMR